MQKKLFIIKKEIISRGKAFKFGTSSIKTAASKEKPIESLPRQTSRGKGKEELGKRPLLSIEGGEGIRKGEILSSARIRGLLLESFSFTRFCKGKSFPKLRRKKKTKTIAPSKKALQKRNSRADPRKWTSEGKLPLTMA